MSETVYIVLAYDQWGDETMIEGVYASKEAAEIVLRRTYEPVSGRWGRVPVEPSYVGQKAFREYAVIEAHEVKGDV